MKQELLNNYESELKKCVQDLEQTKSAIETKEEELKILDELKSRLSGNGILNTDIHNCKLEIEQLKKNINIAKGNKKSLENIIFELERL